MKVFLESELYGYEKFTAENIEEAIAIIGRLYLSCKREFKEDYEPRKIGLIVDEETA